MIFINKTYTSRLSIKWQFLCYWDATKHKAWVFWYISKICLALIRRGLFHDLSKYSPAEVESFERWTKAIEGARYGTAEYKATSALFSKDNRIHYQANPHHPEHYPGGIKDMSLLDMVEMLADWKAATRRRVGASMERSLEINAVTYKFEDGLKDGIERDIKEIGL